jgi:hypothetical protein
MKLRLVAVVTAFVTLPAFVHAQGWPSSNAPKPTKADTQKVVQIISNDRAKTQAYCDLNKVYDQMQTADQNKDNKKVEALGKQADALSDKLGALALLDWRAPQIFAIEFDQIESDQQCIVTVALVADEVEHRQPALIGDNRLAVEQEEGLIGHLPVKPSFVIFQVLYVPSGVSTNSRPRILRSVPCKERPKLGAPPSKAVG